MNALDALWLGTKALRERRTRAALTVLSVMIGVASIISLVSQTAGIGASIVGSLEALGPTSIFVTGQSMPLTAADVSRISSLPHVEEVIPVVSGRAQLGLGGQPLQVNIIGVDSAGLLALLGRIDLVAGSIYGAGPSPLAVVGYDISFPLSQGGRQAIFVGQPLILYESSSGGLRRATVNVVGLLAKYSASPFIPVDSSIFLPLQAALQILNRHSYTYLLVRADELSSVEGVRQNLVALYGDNAQILTVQQVAETATSILAQLTILLGSVAGISLSVAALGIMNIMLVSVYERTREIGILKALGFTDGDVLLLFLSEAAVIGALGGLLGLAAGVAGSYALPLAFGSFRMGPPGGRGFQLPSYQPVIEPELLALSFAIAVAVSIAGALYPALRASRIEPVRALRYE
jgi:putative ABC transport system permease protein